MPLSKEFPEVMRNPMEFYEKRHGLLKAKKQRWRDITALGGVKNGLKVVNVYAGINSAIEGTERMIDELMSEKDDPDNYVPPY